MEELPAFFTIITKREQVMRYEGKPHWARENSILTIFFFLYRRERMKDVNYLTSYCDKSGPNDHVVHFRRPSVCV